MAKIYETEQDKHRELASLDFAVGSAFQRTGIAAATFSFIAAALSYVAKRFISKDAKDIFGGSQQKNMERNGAWMIGLGAAGVASAVAGFFIRKRATALMDKLGPEQIVSPAESQDYMKTQTGHAAKIASEQAASQTLARSL